MDPIERFTDSPTVFTAASEAAMLLLAAGIGDYCSRSDTSATYILQTLPASVLANWKEVAHLVGGTAYAVRRIKSDSTGEEWADNRTGYPATDYGAATLTAATINTAIATLTTGELVLKKGSWTIDVDVVVPDGFTIDFKRGAYLNIDVGHTVTFQSGSIIKAGPYQIFAGLGTPVFGGTIKEVYPEWWGIDGTADEVEINKAINCLSVAGDVLLTGTTYTIAAKINLDDKEGIGLVGKSRMYESSPHIIASDAIVMVSLDKSKYCRLRSLWIDGNSLATHGIYSYSSSILSGNYENEFWDIFISKCTIGMAIGTTDNYQTENKLTSIFFSECTTGLYLRGQNSLANRMYDCKFELCGIASDIAQGNIVCFNTIYLRSITLDILLGACERPTIWIGGETEQGTGRFLQTVNTGTNYGYVFIGFDINADSSTDPEFFIYDGSLFGASFINCRFHNGAGTYFPGFVPLPVTQKPAVKAFDNCTWCDAAESRINPRIVVHPEAYNVRIVLSNLYYDIPTLNDSDVTPSVSIFDTWYCNTTYAPGITITMFDQGFIHDTRRIIFKDSLTTIDFTGTHLKGNGGVDWSPKAGDWMDMYFDGTDWYCSIHSCTV